MAHDPYFTKAELEARVGARTVQRILDDDNDGDADDDPIERIRLDATSKVDGVLRSKYRDWPFTTVPNEVKRLALDVGVAMLYIRHPEYARSDGIALMELADRDLKLVTIGERSTDAEGSPEPAANHGGYVWDGGPSTVVAPKAFFLPGANGCGGMGDF